MEELKKNFPEGIDYSVVYDPTVFVRHSIEAVIHTLLEAILLVVIVVIIFLQTWRAAIIPLAAVPVSLIGTFLDHARVWVSASTRFRSSAWCWPSASSWTTPLSSSKTSSEISRAVCRPLDAARQAMNEVTGPIVATALVLCAVFVPTAFISGLTGQFYKQFAHHDCDFDGHFRVQFADAFARVVRGAAERSSCAERLAVARDGKVVRLVFPSVQPRVRVGGQANIPPASPACCAKASSR